MSTGDNEGPAWGKFWLSLDNESESMVSGEGGSHRPYTPGHRSAISPDMSRPFVERVDSVQPHESASHNGDESPPEEPELPSASLEDSPFPFKFKAPSGRVHRLQVIASAGMSELVGSVTAKLGADINAVGGEAYVEDGTLDKSGGYALSYLDNEGDTVSITTDQDLKDAISLARKTHRDKVDLFVHDPEKPPMSATVDPHPMLAKPPTPPASDIKSRRRPADDEDEMETPLTRERKSTVPQAKRQEQLIAGVPNDLLLPGAIVTLAVVIIGVFTLNRTNK